MTSGNEHLTITYRALYAQSMHALGSRFETEQLFYHVTKKRAFHLPRCGEQPVPDAQRRMLLRLLGQRAEGVPLQYLLGEWEFYSLPFRVGRGVLIPRQDTETLVDVALELLRGKTEPEVLDLCSGSGCVAIAIEKNYPEVQVTALELSDDALGYLEQNKALNDAALTIVRGNVFEYVHPRPVDLIVSNPPYIPREAIGGLAPELAYEPRQALDGGRDGLVFYRSIIARYKSQMAVGGALCFEVGMGQSEQVAGILAQHGYVDIGVRNDLGGVARVVFGRVGED